MSSVASAAGLIHLGMDTSKNTIVVATLLPGEESPVTGPDLQRGGGDPAAGGPVPGSVGAAGLV